MIPHERWHWNGDLVNPTISPSVRHYYEFNGKQITVCHYFINNGMIQYCDDCEHSLAGKIVELPEV